jgi:cytidylate kinase
VSGCRQREPVITIDGPAGAGKSSAAREIARRLGFRLVDTSAMYRALAWAVRRAGLDPLDSPALRELLARVRIDLGDGQVRVDGEDVTAAIHAPDIGPLTSRLSELAVVRAALTPLQRSLAAGGGAVLEGRDTGSVVWPEAEVKVYLDASLETRARRRCAELQGRGVEVSLAAVREEIAGRDRRDRERALAPLVKPAGAMVVDSTELSRDEVIHRVLEAVEQVRCCTRS